MGKKRKDPDSINVLPATAYGDDFPEISKWDVTFESFSSRMDTNQKILEQLGGFSHGDVSDASVRIGDNSEEISEEISQWLRGQLSQLRDEEKEISKAPVLSGSSIGRATISDIAFMLLEAVGEPGPNLLILLAELLNVDRHRQAMADNKTAEQDIAAQIDAQNPD